MGQDANNEDGALAWGESYVMMSLIEMYAVTREVRYLERLVEHADSVLNQRDSVRKVTDYRGRSDACWQSTRYSTRPYCWAVHSGMIAAPMAEHPGHTSLAHA